MNDPLLDGMLAVGLFAIVLLVLPALYGVVCLVLGPDGDLDGPWTP